MKSKFVLSFILCCSINLCAQWKNIPDIRDAASLKEQSFTLNGTFKGYDPLIDSFQFCKIIYNPLLLDDQQSQLGEIDKTGRFKITFPLNRPQEIFFNFKDAFVSFYAVPGTTLSMEIDLPSIKVLKKLPFDEWIVKRMPLRFEGRYAQLNKELNAFAPWLITIGHYKEHNKQIRSLEIMEYKQYRLQMMQRSLDTLTVFNKQYNTSAAFRHIASMTIQYKAAEDLLRYHWLHEIQDDKFLTLSPEYLDFLQKFPIDNPEAVVTYNYSSFLHEWLLYFSPKNAGKLDAVKNFYLKYDSVISVLPPGLGKDILTARLMSRRIDKKSCFSQDELNTILPNIQSLAIRNEIVKVNNEEQRAITGVMPANVRARTALEQAQDKLFEKLLAPYKGKVVYVDFWAPWCGPCMGEMPHSKLLQQEYKGRDVVFLYIGVLCTKTSWEKTIKADSISGEHYFAKENESTLLMTKFNFSGIPHYVLVNKQGVVVDRNAPRPDHQELHDKINQLLKEKGETSIGK